MATSSVFFHMITSMSDASSSSSSSSCTSTLANPITKQCSLRRLDHLPMLKSSDRDLDLDHSSSSKFLVKDPCSSDMARTRKSSSTKAVSPPASSRALAGVWREMQGLNNWENLLDPLDPLLQQEIIRYGEFVSACYKAFDLDPESRRYLNCKYGKKTMLKEVGLENSGYEVTKYIYATAPDIITTSIPIQTAASSCGRWIGYVAVSGDKEMRVLGRRDIVITFRGTVTNLEWITNLMSSLTPAGLDPHDPRPDVKAEAGFLSLYTSDESASKFGLGSCREQLLSEVSRLLNKYKGEEISITLGGHSMGSSLAVLLAYDIAELGLNRPSNAKQNVPVTVFSFGGPRVGNTGFKERCEELGVKVLRVVNVNDPITKLPGVVFNENFRFPWWSSCSCYAHVGVELMLDFFKMHNPSCVHDLESYIGSLLRCPKSFHLDQLDGSGGANLVERAKGFLVGVAAQRIDALRWTNAAMNMVNLVQSQWTVI